MKQPWRCGRPWCHGAGQRNAHGQRHNAVAGERLSDLLAPFLNCAFDGEAVFQMKLFSLKDRQLAWRQILWRFGGVWKNKNPLAAIKLIPTRRRYSHKPRQLLNTIIYKLDGGEQKNRQMLALIADNVGAQVCQPTGDGALLIVDN